MKKAREPQRLPVIGWREWVYLPKLCNIPIKAKIDTGARSSSLHAFHIETIERDGKRGVRFRIHPLQRETRTTVTAEADLLEYRTVKSSGGHETVRPVILTPIELLGRRWTVELTLVARDAMGFRMLLGRQAIRRRFTVDPNRSFLAGQPPRPARRKKKRRSSDEDTPS